MNIDSPSAQRSHSMVQRYRIAWRLKSGGLEGHGEPLDIDVATATSFAVTANAFFPEYEHWVEVEPLD